MITKKRWNELSEEKRNQIVDLVFHDIAEEFRREYACEWHHNIDEERRELFNSIFENENGLYVKVSIN